jgi:hypothetical protein
MKSFTLTTLLLLSGSAFAFIGGPCSGDFNAEGDCICLKDSVCTGKWNGVVVTGKKPSWPCPHDDNSIHGCIVPHCDGFFTVCSWRNHCDDQHLGPREQPRVQHSFGSKG